MNTSTSSKSQYGALDLHVPRTTTTTATTNNYNTISGPTAATRKADGSGLSARNILIRRKLMERKRFDSADHAMRQQSQSAAASSTPSAFASTVKPPTCTSSSNSRETAAFSPAQVGASVLFNALGGSHDENVDMDADNATSNAMAQAAAAAARSAVSRYGNLSGPTGGAASARNILIQKKLREKKQFDSADYQLAQFRTHATPPSSGASAVASATGDSDDASPMEIDLPLATETTATTPVASINSPSAASVAARSRLDAAAQMSPSMRGGGGGLSGANVLLMRKLSEKKRFDSADYQMQAGPVATARANASAGGRQPQQPHHPTGYGQRTGGSPGFYVAAAPSSSLPTPPAQSQDSTSGGGGLPGTVAAPVSTVASSCGGGGSKYGKLSAVNVLIRKKLKERKRFDSADYAMEQRQGQDLYADERNQGGAVGALRDGHVVTATAADDENEVATPATQEENKSISHQVKHIKLSEAGGGWATRVPSATASGSSPTAGAATTKLSSQSHDSRLAARNLIIQRKLSERKRFDSADYFKEAAARGHTG